MHGAAEQQSACVKPRLPAACCAVLCCVQASPPRQCHLPAVLCAGITSKTVLAAVASAFTHRAQQGPRREDMLAVIAAQPAGRRLYVLLHNIDGPGRCHEAARVLQGGGGGYSPACW